MEQAVNVVFEAEEWFPSYLMMQEEMIDRCFDRIAVSREVAFMLWIFHFIGMVESVIIIL